MVVLSNQCANIFFSYLIVALLLKLACASSKHIFFNFCLWDLCYRWKLCEKLSCLSVSHIFSLPTERCEVVLPVAEAPGPRVLSAEEQRRLVEQEENTLRELRLFLRDVTKRLATDKRFNIFSKPVDIEEVRRIRLMDIPVSLNLMKPV